MFIVMNNEFLVNPMPNMYHQPQQNINYQQYMPSASNDMSMVINKTV